MRDTCLFFDVDGAGLVIDGPAMRERPTLVLLSGGPGFSRARCAAHCDASQAGA